MIGKQERRQEYGDYGERGTDQMDKQTRDCT